MQRRLARLLAGATRSAAPRLIECGFLSSFPGARAQAFHADTTPASQRACEAQTLKLQLALVQVDAEMGPFEVRPGTHLDLAPAAPPRAPDGERDGERGAGPLPIRVLVGPGDVTVYSSNVQVRVRGSRTLPLA